MVAEKQREAALRRLTGAERRLMPVLAGGMVAAIAAIGLARVFFPYDIGHYEANSWAPAELLAHGHDPYDLSRPTSEPYVAAPYGPLHYLLTGVGLRLFGTNFWFMRLGSVFAILGTALCIGAICYLISDRPRRAAAIGAVTFLASFPVMFWVGLQRADAFALALSMAALLFAVRGAERERPLMAVGAGLAAAGTVLCRQTAVLPLLIVLAIYASHRDRRGAVVALSSSAALLAGVFVAFYASSGSDAIHQLYTAQRGVPFEATLLWTRLRDLFGEPVTWVIAAWLVVLLLLARRGTPRTKTELPIALLLGYFVAATGLAALTSARAGANLNYWLEPAAAAALLLGFLVGRLSGPRPYLPVLVASSLAAAAAISVARVAHGEVLLWEARPYLDDVTAAVRASTTPDEPSFSVYPELVSKAARRYYVNDFVQYDGRDPQLRQAYLRLLRSRRLGAIVTHTPQAPPGYRRLDLDHPLPPGIFPVYVDVRKRGADS